MGFTGPILVPEECEGLPADLEGVERAPFADQLSRADLFIFEFGLATQTATEPVRAGRQIGPVDKKRLRSSSGCSSVRPRPRPRRVLTAGACRAASSAST